MNSRPFHTALLATLETDEAIEIDLGAVEDADLSLLQLLQALRTAAEAAGRVVRLRSPAPAPVAALLERAGFLAAPSPQDLDFWFHGEAVQ
ncbi:STAS domain-containing protein [Sphingomonas sp. R1]|uniref:STAS domain-containing protein n=1 Tax=Sphingomonas sp. R1 TaxID=399176 RepID=UPI0022255562|nr:STAS domain-containing protein [Sphingomonas sp. R1]UYY77080.1 STAS domain-containing protein [Sphingomonas sp. R1]